MEQLLAEAWWAVQALPMGERLLLAWSVIALPLVGIATWIAGR